MFKYSLDQTVYYLKDNRVHSAPILSRKYVDNQHENWDGVAWKTFGNAVIMYATIHGQFIESIVFPSLEDLKNSLGT